MNWNLMRVISTHFTEIHEHAFQGWFHGFIYSLMISCLSETYCWLDSIDSKGIDFVLQNDK